MKFRFPDYFGSFTAFLNSIMFLKGYPLEAKTAPKNWNKSVHISWVRLASFYHLGVISDPLIVSKLHNETHDPKGQENKIYVHYSEGQGDVLPPPHSPSHQL